MQNLTQQEQTTLENALICAAEQYESIVKDLNGETGATMAPAQLNFLRSQFTKQAEEARALHSALVDVSRIAFEE